MPLTFRLDGVTQSYGRQKALDDVSLEVQPGQLIALLGPNGAGKSTLISCLAGLARPQKGTILYDGRPFQPDDLVQRRRLGYVADVPPTFGNLTVLYYLGLVVRLYGLEDVPEVEERGLQLLEEFELLPLLARPLGDLSRGQVYKAALAALMTVSPELWIIDEPFASGMDPAGLLTFKDRAREAVGRGTTVLFSTQLLESAERFADRICVLDRGRVRAYGPLSELSDLEGLFRGLRANP